MSDKITMSEFLEEANDVLKEIRAYHGLHEKQLQTYKEIIDNNIKIHRERIDFAEKRWENMRNIMLALASIFLLSFVSDKISLSNRPTEAEIKEEYTPTERLYRGLGVIIDDNYDLLEDLNAITKEENASYKNATKSAVTKELNPELRSRSAVEVKE